MDYLVDRPQTDGLKNPEIIDARCDCAQKIKQRALAV